MIRKRYKIYPTLMQNMRTLCESDVLAAVTMKMVDQQVPPKRLCKSTKLHGVTTQKKVILIFITMRTPSLTTNFKCINLYKCILSYIRAECMLIVRKYNILKSYIDLNNINIK
jgi:hypothetical protein